MKIPDKIVLHCYSDGCFNKFEIKIEICRQNIVRNILCLNAYL